MIRGESSFFEEGEERKQSSRRRRRRGNGPLSFSSSSSPRCLNNNIKRKKNTKKYSRKAARTSKPTSRGTAKTLKTALATVSFCCCASAEVAPCAFTVEGYAKAAFVALTVSTPVSRTHCGAFFSAWSSATSMSRNAPERVRFASPATKFFCTVAFLLRIFATSARSGRMTSSSERMEREEALARPERERERRERRLFCALLSLSLRRFPTLSARLAVVVAVPSSTSPLEKDEEEEGNTLSSTAGRRPRCDVRSVSRRALAVAARCSWRCWASCCDSASCCWGGEEDEEAAAAVTFFFFFLVSVFFFSFKSAKEIWTV